LFGRLLPRVAVKWGKSGENFCASLSLQGFAMSTTLCEIIEVIQEGNKQQLPTPRLKMMF